MTLLGQLQKNPGLAQKFLKLYATQAKGQQVAQFAAKGEVEQPPKLATGAVGTLPSGEPYYGPGLGGYFMGKYSRVNEPQQQLNAETGKLEEIPPSYMKRFGRLAKESFFGVLDILNLSAKSVKSWYGFGMGLEDAANHINAVVPQTNPQFWDYIWNAGPVGMGINTYRILSAPGDKEENMRQARTDIENNLQASRIMYSSIIDPMKRQDFIRRYQDGENPDYLVSELQNPWIEMAGEIIFDPLNVIGGVVGKAMKVSRKIEEAAKLVEVAPEVSKVLEATVLGLKAGKTAEAAAREAKLAEVLVVVNNTKWDEIIKSTIPEAERWTMTTRRARVGEAVFNTITSLLRPFRDNPNEAGEILDAMVKMSSSNADEAAVAIPTALKYGDALFQNGSRDAGLILRKMLTNAKGEIDAVGFLEDARKLDQAEFIEKMGARLSTSLEEMYPTVVELSARRVALLEAGDIEAAAKIKINPVLEKLARAHEFAQTKLGVRKFNSIFSRVWMGITHPATAIRNFLTNEVMGLIDEGPGIWTRTAKVAKEEIIAWHGSLPPAAARAFMGGAFSVGIEEKGMSIMAKAELDSSLRIFGKSYREAMVQSLHFGMALGDPESLRVAGFTEPMLARLEKLTVLNKGDTAKAIEALRGEFGKSGGVEIFRNLETWLHPQDVDNLKSLNLFDAVEEAMQGTKEDSLKKLGEIYNQRAELAAKVLSESPHPLQDLQGIVEHMTQERGGLFTARVAADRYASSTLNESFYKIYDAVDAAGISPAERIPIRGEWEKQYAVLRQKMYFENDTLTKQVREWYSNRKNYKDFWNIITQDKNWGELGLSKNMPPDSREFSRILWEEFWAPAKELNAREAVNGMSVGFTSLVDRLTALAPNADVGIAMGNAAEAVSYADLVSNATLKQGRGLLYDAFQVAIKRGDNASAVRILAEKYGYATARGTEAADFAGTMDKNLLTTINKYLEAQYKSLDEVPVEEMRKALDAWATEGGREIPKVIEDIKKLAPTYDGNYLPSKEMVAYQTLPDVQNAINNISYGINNYWGKVELGTFTPEMEQALYKWQDASKMKIARADRVAVSVASNARDFALHNYAERDVFDLAYAYLLPYGFFYRKTYTKILRRMAEDPQVLAAYAKYRRAMEKENANLPEWWRYNIKVDNILGIPLKSPLFFNLEATLNPLNGITGVDFSDPYKRVNWWTSMLDDVNQLGPSTWLPIQLATAYALHIQGKDDAASRWAGRIFPQTTVIKALTNIAGVKAGGVELDPAVVLFSGGLDPYERNRVGRALGMLVNEGANEAEAIEAARTQSGPLWEAAKTRAMNERQYGQLAGYFLGLGFKNRSVSDMSIDQFYNDYNSIWNNEANLSGEELKASFDRLRKDYPFMDVLLLARKGSIERDRSYSYSVLSRIPPAQLDDVADAVSLDRRLIDKFYDEKGKIDQWTESDRMAFMSAMVGIGALLDIPPQATRTEWSAASSAYRTMADAGESLFGESIWDEVDLFYQQDNKDVWLQSHPQVQAVLDWKAQYVLASPLLSAYYGGEEIFYRYYRGQMLKDMTNQLGGDILVEMQTYWDLTRYGNQEDVNAYKRLHPNISKYYDIYDKWQVKIDLSINKLLKTLPEGEGIVLRKEKQQSIAGQDLLAAQQPPLTWNDWKGMLSSSAEDALLAYFKNGAPIPYFTEKQLTSIAEDRGTSYGQLLSAIGQTIP